MYKKLIIFSAIALCIGFITYAYFNHWIIIAYPRSQTHTTHSPIPGYQKKKITLCYWHNNNWRTENSDLLWSNNKVDCITYLIRAWLSLLEEETATNRSIALQTAILTSSQQELFLSFDRKPFGPESNTHTKWMWIEGLLKTIRLNNLDIQRVTFLEHHQPLQDDHVDFSNPWPIKGFLPS
ncbi:MAG TPA: hypothetical protein VGT41_01045 [Candidatus Babeliales bacterium]|nr:hypothetical protein [Candidatus Babeliales bacterium]